MKREKSLFAIQAFTLAEVLITLAIIGVVAALTIPTLVSNYQKTQYVTQLKKFYSTFNNGMKTYMASMGCDDMRCTEFFKGATSDAEWQTRFKTEIPKIFRNLTIYTQDNYSEFNSLNYPSIKALGGEYANPGISIGGAPYTFITADGQFVAIIDNYPGNCDQMPNADSKLRNFCSNVVFVDVNGPKGPNISGRDAFGFYLGNDGLLYPYSGYDMGTLYGAPDSIWKLDSTACGTPGSSKIDDNVGGNGCAARIMEEGWQMNY